MYFVIAAANAGSEAAPSPRPPGSAGAALAALHASFPLSALTQERVLPATVVVAPAVVQGAPTFAVAAGAAFGVAFVAACALALKLKMERAIATIAVALMTGERFEVSFISEG